MSEQVKESVTVTISNGKIYRGAFERQDVRLYIPVDQNDNLANVDDAVKLQCWAMGERNSQIPEIMSTPKGLSATMLKSQDCTEFGWLSRSVAYGSLARMDAWLYTLHRDTAGDIVDMQIYYRN